jgi:uncharacterized protein (TIRG00374 family)
MSIALRVLVSAALLVFISYQVDWRSVSNALAQAQWAWFAFAFLAFNLATVFAALRWRLIVASSAMSRQEVGAGSAVAATYASLWLSNFLPTAFGGDVARVVVARKSGVDLPVALGSAVLDRGLGFMTFVFLFVVAEVVLAAAGQSRPLLPVAAAMAFGFAVLFALLKGGAHFPVRRRWLRSRLVRFIVRTAGVLRTFGIQSGTVGRVLLASLAATMLGILAYWGAVRCVSSSVDFPVALAAAVLGTVASAMPVSLSGWGVREGTVAFVLTHAGALSASDASLVAILNAIVIAATSLIGLAVSVSVGWRGKAPVERNDRAEAHRGRRS